MLLRETLKISKITELQNTQMVHHVYEKGLLAIM